MQIAGATGGSLRHSLMLEYSLRPVLTHLGMLVTPTAVYAATEEFGNGSALQARAHRAAKELRQLSKVDLKPQTQTPSFTELLQNLQEQETS